MTTSPLPDLRDAPRKDAGRLRERLRAETRAEHEALDQLFEGMLDAAGMAEGAAPARYALFLRMNRDAHRALDPILARGALPAALVPDGTRRKAAERDCALLALDEAVPTAGTGELPARPSRAQAFGIAYVMEGSRLGARFLSRSAAQLPGDARNRVPTHYLEASSDTRPFADLMRAVETSLPAREEADEMVRAAKATFRYFRALTADREPGETTTA